LALVSCLQNFIQKVKKLSESLVYFLAFKIERACRYPTGKLM